MFAKQKLIIYTTRIKTKLLYGLESVQLSPSLLPMLNAVQLKGLRQILDIPTTEISRDETNARVFELANRAYSVGCLRATIPIQPVTQEYQATRLRLLGHILHCCDKEPELCFSLIVRSRIYTDLSGWASPAFIGLWRFCSKHGSFCALFFRGVRPSVPLLPVY